MPDDKSPSGQRSDSLLYGPDDKPLPLSAREEKLLKKARKESLLPPKGIQAHKRLFASLLAGATLLGAIVVFVPRPTVIPSDPVDPDNSMSSSFTITNTGFIPLRHVTATLHTAHPVMRIKLPPS